MSLISLAVTDTDNIVTETRRLRAAAGLPSEFVVLDEESESSILLNTATSEVVWCHSFDVTNLAAGRALDPDTDRFDSDGAFFGHLIGQEEAERVE